ncbi:unnamed protein product [Camellia sinensis]
MQLGDGSSVSNNCSNGSCNKLMATLKFLSRSREGTVSTVSHLSGRPASTDGNRRERRRRGSPDSIARLMIGLNLEARRGVVTTVTVTPCCANNLAMSIMGMKWPGAIRGTKTK